MPEKKLKIIFIGDYNPGETLTGPGKVAKRVFADLNLKSDSVFVEYFSDGSKYSIWQKLFGKTEVKDDEAGINKNVFRLGLVRTILFIVKFKPQLIHIIVFQRFSVIIFLLKYIVGFKVSYTVHGIISYENQNFRTNLKRSLLLKDKIAEKIIYKYSDKLFFLSEMSENIAKNFYSISNSKVVFISNGIDEVFSDVFKERQFLSKKKLNIVLVADSSRPEKGMEYFFRIIEHLHSFFNIYIIGKIPEQKIGEVKIISKMPTTLWAEFLKQQDIIVSTSIYDPFPISIIEGMASGAVPVITDKTGVSKIIINGQNGFVFPCNDSEQLLDLLLKLKDNYELLKKISLNASEIYDELKWDQIGDQYLNMFYRMCSE